MKHFLLFVIALSLTFSLAKAQTEMLTGGNMEDVSLWQTSLLNTEEGKDPTVTWNYTSDAPTAGQGGNLHVTGSIDAGNSQYCIYQKVNLSSDSVYSFDAAYKAIQINNSWCEIFIGTEPVDGSDYGEGQTRLAAFGTWAGYNKSDGIVSEDIDPANYATFAPSTSGEYFFVLKMGSTSWDGSTQTFEIIVDELSLVAGRTAPVAAFSADKVTGVAPLEVKFTSESAMATSWSWNFGDGSAASTEENPTHTYATEGTYTVTLKATNELGDDTEEKAEYIKVNPNSSIEAGGVIVGGEMEDESKWNISFLATPAGSEPTVSWNDTEHVPSAGKGGAFFATGNSNNSTVQVALYQKITLSDKSTYVFNAAVKDFTDGLNQAWYEVFIGAEPVEGEDYSKDSEDNTLIAEFSTWSNECSPTGIDGTFQLNACNVNAFIPETSGDYYFVIKFGSTSWAGDNMPFSLALDEISLLAEQVKPITKFSADNPLGFAPLTVQFTDESDFAETWSWDFGDGSDLSTEQNPEHTYTAEGSYTVTLTASNDKGETVLVKEGYIKVNAKPDQAEGEMLYGGNMEDPNLWNISGLNGVATTTAVWNNTENTMEYGEGGNLMLSASALNNQSMYCIWQTVELKEGMKYTFDAAFKDLSENLDHFWSEVFIGTSAPVDGEDYGEGQAKIAFFNSWNDNAKGIGVDGTYLADGSIDEGTIGVFVPETTGTYYFAIKTGIIDWEGNEYSFKVLIDEVSLMESVNVPAPKADFFADITEGDAPLEVYFTDLSENASSWEWNFGDGTTSTEQSPSHTYESDGTYTVTLIVHNEDMNDTMTVEDLIVVGTGTAKNELESSNAFHVYPNPSNGDVQISLKGIDRSDISISDLSGRKVKCTCINESNDYMNVHFEQSGIYLIRVIKDQATITRKLVIRK